MFPIPPPDRLFPRFPNRGPGGGSQHTILSDLAENVYFLGLFGICAIATYAVAARAAEHSLLIALVAAAATIYAIYRLLRVVAKKSATVFFVTVALVETVFYAALAFQARLRDSSGADVSGPIWPFVVLVTAVFGWTTYMMWRRTRD